MMLAKHIFPVALLTVLVTSSLVKREATEESPLLTAMSKDPELSTFYSLFNGTGGTSGIPGSQFEERFNALADGRNFTAFAPVNSAFMKLHPGLTAALTGPASYPLLESILRTHIAEGSFTTEDVRTPGKSIISIEGIPLTFNSAGDTVTINNQARLASMSRVSVGNGAFFKITSVIDPLVDMFGTDMNKTTRASPNPGPENLIPAEVTQNPGTIASALSSSPNLSIYTDLFKSASPDFFTLLNGSPPNGKNLSIFAPSNAAFQALGKTAKILQPRNQPFVSYLLKYPFIDTTAPGQDTSIVGFPAMVRRDGTGAITRVNNADVKGKKYCVSNACVYIVDRWLDPVFGLF